MQTAVGGMPAPETARPVPTLIVGLASLTTNRYSTAATRTLKAQSGENEGAVLGSHPTPVHKPRPSPHTLAPMIPHRIPKFFPTFLVSGLEIEPCNPVVLQNALELIESALRTMERYGLVPEGDLPLLGLCPIFLAREKDLRSGQPIPSHQEDLMIPARSSVD